MAQVIDPVCGMTIESEHAAATAPHGDHVHYFCSPDCASAFRASPARYVRRSPKRAGASSAT